MTDDRPILALTPTADPDGPAIPPTTTPEEEPMSDPTTTRTAVTGALAEIPQVSVADGALGAVITSSADRRRIYTVWTIIGLVLQGLGAGAASALAAGFALWAALTLGVDEQVRVAVAPWVPLIVTAVGLFAFATGIYRALSPQVSSLAVANTRR